MQNKHRSININQNTDIGMFRHYYSRQSQIQPSLVREEHNNAPL